MALYSWLGVVWCGVYLFANSGFLYTILLPICAVLSFPRNNAVDFSLYPAFMRTTGQATCHGKCRALNVSRCSVQSLRGEEVDAAFGEERSTYIATEKTQD